MELYELGALSFSFEIKYVLPDTVEIDGVRYVDASDRNVLFGMTIVTTPAYDESVALNLVAEENTEILSDTTESDEGVETMKDKVNEAVTEQEAPVVEVAQNEAIAEEVAAETPVVEDVSEEKVEETVAEAEVNVEETVAEETSADTVAEAEPKEDEEKEDDKEDEEEEVETASAGLIPVLAHPEECVCEESAEDAAIDAAHAGIEADEAKLRAQIAQLEAELEMLRAEHMELEAYRAAQRAQELQAKQTTVRVFAEKQGLDTNDEEVSKAIAELDYEKLVNLSMEGLQTEQIASASAETQVTSSFIGSESMSVDGKYARVLARNN